MLRFFLTRFLVFILSCCSHFSFAQTEDLDAATTADLDQVEAEIKKSEVIIKPKEEKKEGVESKVETLSDLSKLQSFSEISVMQRRYMPKTNRLQFFGGLSTTVNDPWNSALGGNLRMAYGFTEAWGAELNYFTMNNSPNQSAHNLYNEHGVDAQSFGTMTGYTGASIMWTPIYGKMTFLNKKIVPFDMYFTLGGGTVSLIGSNAPSSASAVSLSGGQIFAISRSLGFRWDLTWNMYTLPSGAINNLLLTFGASFYIPEAQYR